MLLISFFSQAQLFSFLSGNDNEVRDILMDRAIQIETTAAINNMYNYKFDEAEREFKWLRVKYPQHPIGPFLLGLNTWWKLVPDTGVKKYDDTIHDYMDQAIDMAENMPSKSKEAAFFSAAAYAFKGRLYAERENWVKAAWAGKQALKYLEKSRGDENINPELLFGDGVYNFYSKWINENYKSLRPLLTFFRKGDKNLGIKQLENVSNNAFYTRMEARYFLVQIYSMEDKNGKALSMARQMHTIYPDNSFFDPYAARCSFALGRLTEAETYAKELLQSIEAKKYGYGPNDGRYGTYIIAYVNKHYYRNKELAKEYYQKCTEFAEENDSEDSGYYMGAQLALGDYAMEEGDYLTAARKYKLIIDQKNKKSSSYKEAQLRIKELKTKIKAAKAKKK